MQTFFSLQYFASFDGWCAVIAVVKIKVVVKFQSYKAEQILKTGRLSCSAAFVFTSVTMFDFFGRHFFNFPIWTFLGILARESFVDKVAYLQGEFVSRAHRGTDYFLSFLFPQKPFFSGRQLPRTPRKQEHQGCSLIRNIGFVTPTLIYRFYL
jgi:hypothetical protein